MKNIMSILVVYVCMHCFAQLNLYLINNTSKLINLKTTLFLLLGILVQPSTKKQIHDKIKNVDHFYFGLNNIVFYWKAWMIKESTDSMTWNAKVIEWFDKAISIEHPTRMIIPVYSFHPPTIETRFVLGAIPRVHSAAGESTSLFDFRNDSLDLTHLSTFRRRWRSRLNRTETPKCTPTTDVIRAHTPISRIR